MNLMIVESPNKVKKIKTFLGPGWDVAASVGHGLQPILRAVQHDQKRSHTSRLSTETYALDGSPEV